METMLSEKDTQVIRDILMRELDVAPGHLTPEASIKGDLGADSLTEVQIIMAIEEQFDLTVSDELASEVKTVGDLYETVAKLRLTEPRSNRVN